MSNHRPGEHLVKILGGGRIEFNTCQSCIFWKAGVDKGQCRKGPPTIHGFPPADKDEYCDEFFPVTAFTRNQDVKNP